MVSVGGGGGDHRTLVVTMDSPDDQSQVFIVRFWREPWGAGAGEAQWRGVVEHMKSGDRRFIQSPDDIGPFVATYVGAERFRNRIKRWLLK